jgi:inner membrane protein
MSTSWVGALGWTATAIFAGSYFFSRPSQLRAAQMAGSVLWITYGLLIGASPVIVANILVFSAAAWTMIRRSPSRESNT